MKRRVVILTGLLIIGSFLVVATSYAASYQVADKTTHKIETIAGTIIAIDEKTNEITVKIDKTNEERKFMVNAKSITALKVNEEVKVKFEPGSSVAQKVINKHNKITTNKYGQ